MSVRFVLILLLVVGLTAMAFPNRIGYQGKLTNPSGVAIEGPTAINFSLWNALSGGDSLWGENNTVAVEKGLFDVILGDVNPINIDLSNMLWVQIIVAGERLTPRQPLNAVPVALYANYADSLIGGVIVDHNDMDGLQGGDALTNQYYHLTLAQVNQIAQNTTNIGNRLYTEENFVRDGEPLSSSVDALDIAVGAIAAGGANAYVRNQEASAQPADFWINGDGRIDGDLRVNNILGQGTGSGTVTPIVAITSTSTPATLAQVVYTAAGTGSQIQLDFSGTFDDRGGQDGAYVNVELVRNPGVSEVVISQISVSIYSSVVHQYQSVSINGVDNPPAGTHTYAVRAKVAKNPYTAGRCLNGVLQLAEIKN